MGQDDSSQGSKSLPYSRGPPGGQIRLLPISSPLRRDGQPRTPTVHHVIAAPRNKGLAPPSPRAPTRAGKSFPYPRGPPPRARDNSYTPRHPYGEVDMHHHGIWKVPPPPPPTSAPEPGEGAHVAASPHLEGGHPLCQTPTRGALQGAVARWLIPRWPVDRHPCGASETRLATSSISGCIKRPRLPDSAQRLAAQDRCLR